MPSEVLQAASDLIPTPEKWTQGAYARDADGESVSWDDPAAVCFCSQGAIRKASGASFNGAVFLAERYLSRAFGDAGIITSNDTSSHARVRRAFSEAIEMAQAAGE
jgi:hypothetical protein